MISATILDYIVTTFAENCENKDLSGLPDNSSEYKQKFLYAIKGIGLF